MKKILILLMLFCLIFSSCGKQNVPSESGTETPSEDKREPENINEQTLSQNCDVYDFGIPYLAQYGNETDEDILARTVWDMQVFDGKLLIAAGDRKNNKGPFELVGYDFASETYKNFGKLDDEQICKFKVVNDSLFIPGTDPTGYPYYGYIYILNEGDELIEAKQTIPEGVNCFDICENGGLLFAVTGTDTGGTGAVCVSSDWGKSFKQLNFVKDNKTINKNLLSDKDGEFNGRCRAYNIFTYLGKVYCTFTVSDREEYNGLYVYNKENEYFEFYSEVNEVFGDYVNCRVIEHNEKIIVCNTRELYAMSSDLSEYSAIEGFGENEQKCDILVKDGVLYVLTNEKNADGKYTVRIKSIDPASGLPVEFCSFKYQAPMLSFEYYGGSFYLGAGSGCEKEGDAVSEKCGTVLKVSLKA